MKSYSKLSKWKIKMWSDPLPIPIFHYIYIYLLHFCEVFPSNTTAYHPTPKSLWAVGWALPLPRTASLTSGRSNESFHLPLQFTMHASFWSPRTPQLQFLSERNTFPPTSLPKGFFPSPLFTVNTHGVKLRWLWLKSVRVVMSEWLARRKETAFTYDYQVPVLGKITALFPYI